MPIPHTLHNYSSFCDHQHILLCALTLLTSSYFLNNELLSIFTLPTHYSTITVFTEITGIS